MCKLKPLLERWLVDVDRAISTGDRGEGEIFFNVPNFVSNLFMGNLWLSYSSSDRSVKAFLYVGNVAVRGLPLFMENTDFIHFVLLNSTPAVECLAICYASK